MIPGRKLRVLVVDDSAYNRRTIAEILSSAPDLELVGKAGDGEDALQLLGQLKPDVITLDLEMPRMDGFTFLRILMSRHPTPVIVISSYSQKENIFKALELGAIDFVAKPERQPVVDPAFRDELLSKIALVRSLRPLRPTVIPPRPSMPSISNEAPTVRQGGPVRHLVAFASSTGGPTALVEIFSKIPERFPGAILVAQHMPEKFTKTFAERLNKKGHLRVTEAENGDLVENRTAFVCPGRLCMSVEVVPSSAGAGGELRLSVGAPAADDRYVPSGDRLLRSAASAVGTRAIGIILTGMGDDGVSGARAIREVGGTVIAESEETAVVHGMPAAAVRAGVVDEVLTLEEIAEFLALLA